MDSHSFALAFLALGAALANAAAWLATDRRRAPLARVAALVLGLAPWLALAQWHARGGLVAAHPGQATSVAVALFVVLGFPAWVARQVARRAAP